LRLLIGHFHNALVQLHNWLTSALFGRQFGKRISDFVCHFLHHIDFIACPGTSVVALLQNHATMRRGRTLERDAK
jgi:hypothetical protein